MINKRKTEIIISKFKNSDVRNKLFIRRNFLNMIHVPSYKRTCLILPGWNYNRCMYELEYRNLINRKSTKVVMVEKNRDIFDNIYQEAKSCIYYRKNKVRLLHCSLEETNFHDVQFQDIDLTCTWKNAFNLLSHRLCEQAKSDKWFQKYFMFSVSERKGGGLEYSYECLKEVLKLIGFNLNGFNETYNGFGPGKDLDFTTYPGSWIKQYKPISNDMGKVKEFRFFRYKDTQIMSTGMIVYK